MVSFTIKPKDLAMTQNDVITYEKDPVVKKSWEDHEEKFGISANLRGSLGNDVTVEHKSIVPVCKVYGLTVFPLNPV